MNRRMLGKSLLVLSLLAVVALAAWPLLAAPPAGAGSLRELQPRRLARILDLTADQTARSRELFRRTVEQNRPVHERMRTVRGELRTALDASTPDDAAIGKLNRQLHGLRQELKIHRNEFVEGFEGLLTPRQKERFERLREIRRELRSMVRDAPRELGVHS